MKGTRLLCSEIDQPLVCYNLTTLEHPISSASIRLSAQGYRVLKGSLKFPGKKLLQNPCCFVGADDEFVVGASNDDGIYMWHVPDREGMGKVERSLRVLRGHRDTVRSVRYSINNGVLASCGNEGIVKLWSTEAM